MESKRFHIIILTFIVLVLSSCSVKRYVPEGQYLVKKNTVVIEGNKDWGRDISKSELSSYIVQKPYKNVFESKYPSIIYFKAERKPNSKFWKWMNRNFGKETTFYEASEADRSATQMKRYLDQIGHFNSEVTHTVKLKKKMAKVTYHVLPTQPYRINKINYYIDDTLIERYIMRDKDKFPVKENDIYNENNMKSMREMITERLRNSGYYYFSRNNIRFEVDSNFMNHTLEVSMRIQKTEHSHKQYSINSISIYPNYSVLRANETPSDSITLTTEVGRRRRINNVLDFYYYGKPRVRPQTLTRSIQIVTGMPYNLRSVTSTYRGLNNFRLFSNVNVTFDTVPNDSLNLLDCKITMHQNDVHSYSIQAEGTHSDGDLGIKGNLSYTNKNIFHGAETFQLSLRGGLEAQRLTLISDDDENTRIFNTRELGVTASLQFPRFLSPIPLRNFARDYQPTTTLNLGFNAQVRYYYSRYISSASISYDWKSNYQLRQTFSPIFFNGVKIDNIHPTFQTFLDAETNQRKKDQYTNHLVLGTRYSLIYNTQNINQQGSFFYLRADLESSGNLLSLFNRTKLITENNGHHELFDIPYAQYVRGAFDLRQHLDLGRESWLVFRQFIGLGVPYGNSADLPFERSFHAGGANSLRGWTYRGVGPGAYIPNEQDIEKIGDIQLELNAEYRFPIYNIINGALFVDAGNVWNFNPNEAMPDGNFKFDTFYKQLAIDAGFGIRADVSFLILRVDMAYALRNPYPDANGNYWRDHELFLKNTRLQIGIGYPF